MKKLINIFLVRSVFFTVKAIAVFLCIVIGVFGYFAEVFIQIYYSAQQIYTLSTSAVNMCNDARNKYILYIKNKDTKTKE